MPPAEMRRRFGAVGGDADFVFCDDIFFGGGDILAAETPRAAAMIASIDAFASSTV